MSIWLEIRVTQGRTFSPEDEDKVARLIEETLDVPARNAFCESEGNFLYCFIRLDEARVPVNRLEFYRGQLLRVWNKEGRGLDEINVVDEQTVEHFIPEAVR